MNVLVRRPSRYAVLHDVRGPGDGLADVNRDHQDAIMHHRAMLLSGTPPIDSSLSRVLLRQRRILLLHRATLLNRKTSAPRSPVLHPPESMYDLQIGLDGFANSFHE